MPSETTTAETVAPDAAAPGASGVDGRQVQVVFFSRQSKYAVKERPFLIPTRIRRFGLSETVNHLLALPKSVPFDFIINGRFLKTSLQAYIDTHSISTENILRVEFVEASLPPTETAALEHDEWISSVKFHSSLPFILTGSYDGVARVWSTTSVCVQRLSAHSAPIKCVAWANRVHEVGGPLIFTGSQDQTVSAFSLSKDGTDSALLYRCVGHRDSVESISVSDDASLLATGSWDQTIRIWTTDPKDVETTEEERSSNKRVKLSEKRNIKSPETTLVGHAGTVTGVSFGTGSEGSGTIYSCSMDHSIREWDVQAQSSARTMSCEKAANCLSVQKESHLITTGHSDSMVRLWDPRSNEGQVVKMKLSGHSNWVSSVVWSPNSNFHLASSSYDGSIRIWDMRSVSPVHVLPGVPLSGTTVTGMHKVFAIDWMDELLCSGGDDSKLRIYQTPMNSEQ